jgi:hypothetical protein
LSGVSAFGFGLLTFVCTFGGALLGIWVRSRLPTAHLSKESQDVIRLGMGLVATMTALLLGLVTAAAKGSFDSQDVAVRNAAAGILTMDRMLARYGPETQPPRDLLRQVVAARVEETWPAGGEARANGSVVPPKGGLPAEAIEDQILRLAPETDAQRWFKAEALKLSTEVLRTRWRLLGSVSGAVPRAFLAVVIFWLSMTFASFGVSAPKNATVLAVFFVAAFSVAAAVFLIFELDSPFDGLIRISSEPFRQVLANLGR